MNLIYHSADLIPTTNSLPLTSNQTMIHTDQEEEEEEEKVSMN